MTTETADRKPRRTLTVADHVAAKKARIARCEAALAEAEADLRDYIAEVQRRAESLTAQLEQE